VGVCALEKL
jgi:hypothetical protein